MFASEVCSICKSKVDETHKYFCFPKLPSSSSYDYIFGKTHLNCLRTHPEKFEIQNELTRVYLKIFANYSVTPVVVQSHNIIVKNYLEHQSLEIYNFEDFVEFYIPYWQIQDILHLEKSQDIVLGINRWAILIVNNQQDLKIRQNFSRQNPLDIYMPSLNLARLQELISTASLFINNESFT